MYQLTDLMPFAIPFMAAVVAFIFGRYLKINITVQQLIPVLMAIVEAIFKTEIKTKEKVDIPDKEVFDRYRENMAVQMLENTIGLNPVKQKVTDKLFGTATRAIRLFFPVIKPLLDTVFKKR